MSECSDEDCNVELQEHVPDVKLNCLLEKSREKYLKAYELFNDWRLAKGAETCSEHVMLSYFMELSKTRQPTTLWSIYSMLKATIKTKHDVHIETYPNLIQLLKRVSEGHKSKKSKVFTAHDIEKFLKEAPDCNYLATKVVLIIGISGACRSSELLNITVNNIEKHSTKLLLVNLPNTKNKIERCFVIREEYVKIIEKYMALRPKNTKIDRFFLQYRNKKCSRQPMGINKIGGMPREIATFLKLQEPQFYTGHCFRRTSTTLVDSGADLTTLKRYRETNSTTAAERHIEISIENKSSEIINFKNENPLSSPSTTKDRENENSYLLASPRGDLNILKRLRGLKSSTIAEGNTEDNSNKTKINKCITETINIKSENPCISPSSSKEKAGKSPILSVDLGTERDSGLKSNIKRDKQDLYENKSKGNKCIIESVSVKSEDPLSLSTSKESEIDDCSISPPSSPTSTRRESISNTPVTNFTITVPNTTVTFNLQNCSNFTFNF